ncbi:putative LRR receptor-like serine/threonine-protein kinase MRH1 [Acorus calamus]|uniref:LRR receptor-like serine/threonine-protein kinase MRH1 n=1 Tax=Acorus calamus TaxID=4465 RepID=A0AAV9F9Y1_ACOCL|nr:putative LRR receptor-like serine/threonine-protein kinase MRH1 [Acorus calamus]
MGGRWNLYGFHLHRVLSLVVMLHLYIDECLSLNPEGLALLEFRAKVEVNPYEAFANWNPNDGDPCGCILYKNNFSGVIPKELGNLTMLELLDLRGNHLSGMIPAELNEMLSLKHLRIPLLPSEMHFDQILMSEMESEVGCINRKVGQCIWQHSLRKLSANTFLKLFRGKLLSLLDAFPKYGGTKSNMVPIYQVSLNSLSVMDLKLKVVNSVRRRLLEESSNLPASPISSSVPIGPAVTVPSIGSGSFPAVPNPKGDIGKNNPTPSTERDPSVADPQASPTIVSDEKPTSLAGNQPASGKESVKKWMYILLLPGSALLFAVAFVMLLMVRRQGVPKLNRAELEAACEDFSNIIDNLPGCTVFKGTLSNGVEIAVVSAAIGSAKDWSKRSEMLFRKKIDSLSRVNHKNFDNLIGYCDDNETFSRMMVFEYAPNGTLYEHLHVKDSEHLDWTARMRIIMGMAYCLQYMHHDLNPPVSHTNLQSSSVLLTDDYAAKIAEIGFWKEVVKKGKISGDDSSHICEDLNADSASNVYSFGLLLLEIISGKHPYSEEGGSLLNWVTEYFNDKRNISYMIDPSLKAFKDNELDVICEVIQACIHQDPKQRPTMKDIVGRLREVITISPDAATPKLSPLWWAELEILSLEAS